MGTSHHLVVKGTQTVNFGHFLPRTSVRPYVCAFCNLQSGHDELRDAAAFTGASKPVPRDIFGHMGILAMNRQLQQEYVLVGQTETGLKSYICKLCGRGYAVERDLRGRLASKHDLQKEFTCPICLIDFAYKQTLARHMQKQHNNSANA